VASDVFTLTSECKCGYQYLVRLSTRAAGLTRGFSWAGQQIEFEDLQNCPDPDQLVGDYFNVSFSISGGIGVGFGTTILGAGQSPGSFAIQGGVAASAGAVLGRSTLDWKLRIPCSKCPDGK
jgi:hypothetical protein